MIISLSILCATLLLLCCYLGMLAYENKKLGAFYLEKWEQWEHEYYLLRTSPAIKENASIRLSWLPVGDNDAIELIGD